MLFEENLSEYLPKEIIDEILLSQEKERTNSLILNTNKISKEKFISLFPLVKAHPFMENVFYYDKNVYQFGKSYLFDNGALYLIDASSLLVSYYLPIKDNDLILDMCSAPGGKTISLLLHNTNKNLNVISNDISYNRALELSKNIERQGFGNVIVTNNDFLKNYENFKEKFDAIILDAPCSGSAMFRKNDEAKKEWSINKVLKLQETQKQLISIANYMLKPGGYLIYSTCSFSKEENEDVILFAINNFKDFKVLPIENKENYYKSVLLPEAIHLFPNRYEGEGQFICLLQKEGINEISNKAIKSNIIHKDLIAKYSLPFNNEKFYKNEVYFYNEFLNLSKINVLRYGLHVGNIEKNIFTPDFHLAHYLKSNKSIQLNEEEFKKYIHGEEIRKDLKIKNDFYVVSYNGINLGFIKYINGRMKNYYPKGLRH